MKIGIDIRPLTDKYYSGVSEFTYQLLKNLFKIDQKNQYILYYNSFHNLSKRIPIFDNSNVDIKFSKYPNKVFNYILQKGINIPKIDQMLGVDRFFMPHFNFLSLKPNSKLILTVHDLSFLRFSKHFSFRKNIWHYLLNVHKLIERADTIIAISENTKKDIVELYGVKTEKIKVIYSGVGEQFKKIDLQKNEIERVRKKYRLPKKFLLSLNTIEPRKNIIGLIQSFTLYCQENKETDIDLVIAGSRGWKYREILKYQEASIYKDRIHFIDYVDNKDKVILYNLAEVFIYLSFYEGFGFPPLEAMSCHCPVISSANSSLGEVCHDAAIMINPNNPRTCSQAIKAIIDDSFLRKKLIKKGIRQTKKFNWQKTAEKYREILFE